MELGKPSIVSVLAWPALIAITIYLIFAATHKTDDENYAKGSGKNEYNAFEYFYPLSIPGCGPNLNANGTPIKPGVKK